MNLLVTDKNPFNCAAHLDDASLVMQLQDVMRLISTKAMADMHLQGWVTPVHVDTPQVRWMRNSGDHFMWVLGYGYGLVAEYEERYGRSHAAEHILSRAIKIYGYDRAKPLGFINWARNDALNINFDHIQDVPTAYRLYLDAVWRRARRPPRWTNKRPPDWWAGENKV
jgi:hypothetical protein